MTEAMLAVTNANVITLNAEQPKAQAVAIRGNRIVTVGSNNQILKHTDRTAQIINLNGKTVVPGLVDSHVHMVAFGFFLQNIDLRNVKSITEMQQKLMEYAAKNPDKTWITGGRWDHEKFAEKRLPNRWDLDAAVPDRPVFLVRVCGHIAVVNTKALQLANITKQTSKEGTKIDLDPSTAQPNGIIGENALNLIRKATAKPNVKELENACRLACQKAVEAGLTEVHWLVESLDEIRVIQKLDKEGKLPLRVYLGVYVDLLDDLCKIQFSSNSMVRMGFVKILADGSLGARTAALAKPYSDNPETCGMMLYKQKHLDALVAKAHELGHQLGIHAIGDRAIANVLNAYEKTLKKSPRKDHRHRIEHCSALKPQLIEKIKSLGLIASVQPHFIISDFWINERLGNSRAQWAYPFKTLIEKGVTVASGSDCPIENINPLDGIWAAATREDHPEQRLTVEEALKTYTINAAYASFSEKEKGTIEVGKLADLTVLSENPLEIQPDFIRKVQVVMVIVDGRIVYSRN